MSVLTNQIQQKLLEIARIASVMTIVFITLLPLDARALPAFARQTGQNCVSCHAGGQFPELTPYGRMFKMTGYTIGSRGVPLSAMGVINSAKVSNTSKSDNPTGPGGDFEKNGKVLFSGASLFVAGKVTDNVGLFSQITYDNYAIERTGADGNLNGKFKGHTSADNVDLRYADRFIDSNRDLIVGVSLNNNPSVTDPWNTAAAWMQYVPAASVSSHQFADANSPFPSNTTDGNVAGLNAYTYWNKLLYAELGFYRTANRAFTIMSAGIDKNETTKLQGTNNPYWRLALTHEWGAHNIMVGATGGLAHIYDDPADTSDSNSVHRVTNLGVDAQYQYLLDPHTITAQVAYMRQRTKFSANTIAALAPPDFVDAAGNPLAPGNESDTTNVFRAKLSYIYQAKYGGSLAFFNLTGSTNTANQTSGFDPATLTITSTDPAAAFLSTRVNGNLSGNPATRGFTYEAFWTPVQYARVGLQYTAYSKFNGASSNYDGLGRNARDNNTLFTYVWFAY
jgi:hypothetical protein